MEPLLLLSAAATATATSPITPSAPTAVSAATATATFLITPSAPTAESAAPGVPVVKSTLRAVAEAATRETTIASAPVIKPAATTAHVAPQSARGNWYSLRSLPLANRIGRGNSPREAYRLSP